MNRLLRILPWMARPQDVLSAPTATTSADYHLTDPKDQHRVSLAFDTLEEQLHAVINKNADGVNLSALSIRRDTDLLLSLGVSDPMAAKAGTLAQVALELANRGRGVNLSEEEHNISPFERADAVAKAMAIVTSAEELLKKARRNNSANIEDAIKKQASLISRARRGLRAPAVVRAIK